METRHFLWVLNLNSCIKKECTIFRDNHLIQLIRVNEDKFPYCTDWTNGFLYHRLRSCLNFIKKKLEFHSLIFGIFEILLGGSINSFRGIFEFISSKLPCERKEQCEHCDRLTSSKLPKEIKNYRKVYQSAIYTF